MSKRDFIIKRLGEELNISPRVSASVTYRDTPVQLHQSLRASEEILRLIQRLFAGNGSESPRLIVFAGVENGSGCTSVCAHTGEMLAAQGNVPVCMVDANPFAPGLYRYFGMRPGHPVSVSALNSESESIRHAAIAVPGRKLWLMSCIDGINDVESIINTDKSRSRFLEMCSRFDYVLIDAPPVNTSIQTLLLGRMADGVVLVLEANYTRRDTAIRAKESLDLAGVRLLGAVLNKRTYPIPESIYRRL